MAAVVQAAAPGHQWREPAGACRTQAAEVKVFAAFEASHWVVTDMLANRDNPGGMDDARKAHAEANAAVRSLIDANFGWHVFRRRRLAKQRTPIGQGVRKAIDQSDAGSAIQ